LVKKCPKLPKTFVYILHRLGTEGKNKLNDAYEKALSQEHAKHSKKFIKKLSVEYKRLRRKGCPELKDEDYIRLSEYLPSQEKIVAMTNICKKQAEQFISQQAWIESFLLHQYITIVAVFVALREFGVPEKQAIQYTKLAGISQSHYKDIPLLSSQARKPVPYLGDKTVVSIHNNRIVYRSFGSMELKNGYRIKRKKKLNYLLYSAGQRQTQRRRKMCKHLNDYGCFSQPNNTREVKQRKTWKDLLTTAQKKRFPICRKCTPKVKEWYLHIAPNTRYETILDVLYTASALGWEGAHIITGQDTVPFVGAARAIPVSFYQQGQTIAASSFPKTMLHLMVGDKTRYYRRTRKRSNAKPNPKRGLMGLLGKRMGKLHPGGFYGGGGGWGYGGKVIAYGHSSMPKAGMAHSPRKQGQDWNRFDSFVDAKELKKKPDISKHQQVFLSARKDLKFKQLLSSIESIRSSKGLLPQIWLTRSK
jgi:hypothetical protein